MYGKKVLTIDHRDYVVNAEQNNKEEEISVQEARARSVVDHN